MKYVAWIPCLSGIVYFHEILPGAGEFDIFSHYQAKSADSADLLVSSVVDWRDNPKEDIPKQNFFRVVLSATRAKDGRLAGSIFVVDRTNEQLEVSHPDYELSRKPFYGKNSYLEAKLIDHLESNDGTSIDIDYVNNLLSNSVGCFVHRLTFEMTPCGLSSFHYCGSRDIQGRTFSVSDKEASIVVRQSFIYLKSCIHKHVHHERQNDCLTEVHLSTGNKHQDGLLLLGDIKRGLSQIRSQYKTSFHSYSGICLYGFSLLTTLKNQKWVEDKKVLAREKGYLKNLQSSLEVSGLNTKAELGGYNKQFKSHFKSTSVYLLAFVAPILVFLNTMNSGSRSDVRFSDSKISELCGNTDPFGGLCEYFHSLANIYYSSGIVPIFNIIIIMVVTASLISVRRIGGIEQGKGGRLTDVVITSLRTRAYSHHGFSGNTSYKIIRIVMDFGLWLPIRPSDGIILSTMKKTLVLFVLATSIVLFIVGVNYLLLPV